MEKQLSQIIQHISTINAVKNDCKIAGLAFDSRAVKKDFLFFALPGIHVDGNEYILPAIKNGASAIVFQGTIDKKIQQENTQVIFIHVADSRFCMAPIADDFYDSPSKKLVIYGVTGTEGKSTTVFLIWQLLQFLGKKTGFISTVEYSLGGKSIQNPEHQTTPEAPIIQEKLHQMIQNGCTHAVIESSSHGLSPKTNRLGNIFFDAVAFMNVTHEHLEFHGTFEQYRADKANLFRSLNTAIPKMDSETRLPVGVVNLEDESAEYFANATSKEVIGFCIKPVKKIPEKIAIYFEAKNIVSTMGNSRFDLEIKHRNHDGTFSTRFEQKMQINLNGEFNIYNAVAALILVSKTTTTKIEDLAPLAEKLLPVHGRMSVINQGQSFEVIVD
ncbi:MAG: Mur ligase family protein, partial [Treponemataceae bacterium]